MYRSFHIENFRCFRDFEIDGLARVNLIGGRNNVGKTAFLEALYLHSGQPDWSIALRKPKWPAIVIDDDERASDIVDSLFRSFNRDEPVVLSAVDHDDGSTRVYSLSKSVAGEYYFRQDEVYHLGVRARLETQDSDAEAFLVYDESNASFVYQLVDPESPLRVEPTQYQSMSETAPRDLILWFSEVAKTRKTDGVVQALCHLDPRLQDLELAVVDQSTVVHADIGEKRLIPVPLMGEGFGRLLAMLCRIASVQDGYMLIDEIENGIHYSAMKDVWTALAVAAREYDVQIFATTHSWECIVAAHEAFSDNDEDFSYHRLDRRDGDKIEAITYDRNILGMAIKSGLEAR